MVARDSNAAESKAARAATRARITKLDIEIETLRHSHSAEALLIERDKCREELATCKYPVLTLPPEITSEISTQFLPPYPEHSSLYGLLSPSFLCRICRQWRDVALSTPILWSALQLDLNIPRLYEQQLHLLELWLQRSGGCPLSLDFSRQFRGAGDSTASFVKAIVRHAHRWEVIRLILPRSDLQHITGPMPFLRNVFVGPTDYDGRGPGIAPVVLFSQAPKLKDVVLYWTFNPFSITLPWSQITTLTATLGEYEAATILRNTPAIEECCLAIDRLSEWPEPMPPIPPLFWLRSLSLLSPHEMPISMGRFLAALNLPALERITIFEAFLGADPLAALSALRPGGYPRWIEIRGANTDTNIDMYTAAFPQATVSVKVASLYEESDSDLSELNV
ncbi:hypothetical protein B0H11DRAFT_1388969 [Mycena galericulata]|nr:hypothetical protein B0H11DRAFT_1388969 [Mycena galericulata]